MTVSDYYKIQRLLISQVSHTGLISITCLLASSVARQAVQGRKVLVVSFSDFLYELFFVVAICDLVHDFGDYHQDNMSV